MAIDFPSNPSDGQTKTYNGKTWTYDSSTTSWVFTPSTFTESDPIVGAINGLVKANGDGLISAATAGTDYLSSTDDIDTHLNNTGSITNGHVLSWDASLNSNQGGYAWVPQSSGGGSSSTTWTLSADGASSNYIFSGPGIETGNTNNPELFLVRGQTYIFSNQSGSHPFRIQSTSGVSGTAYSTGVTNNDTVGDVIFTVPMDAPDTLYYQCTLHSSMGGTINISGYTNSDVNTLLNNTGSITDGHVLSWDASLNSNQGGYAWVPQSSGGGSSLWSENGSELYRNSQVGIGDFSSTAPSAKLHVQAVSNEPALNCGNNNTSSGSYSTAIGVSCESTAVYSIAMGYNANAWSKFSIAIGNWDTSTSSTSSSNSAEYSVAIGNTAKTSENYALAFGNNVTSGGSKSTAMGHKMASLGTYSFGIGMDNNDHSVSQSSTMAIMGGKVAIDTSTTQVNGVYTLDDTTEKLEVGGAIKIGTTSTALPTGGEIKYDSNDFFGHNGTEWKSLTSSGGGGGTLSSRTTVDTSSMSLTTGSSKTLTVGASASGYITGFKSYSLLKINISQPDLWVTIYTDPNSMSSDANRLYTQDPNPSSGVIAEFITDSNNSGQDIIITPTVIGFNAESTPTDKIYLKVSNIGSSNQTSDFTIQMTVLQLEA